MSDIRGDVHDIHGDFNLESNSTFASCSLMPVEIKAGRFSDVE